MERALDLQKQREFVLEPFQWVNRRLGWTGKMSLLALFVCVTLPTLGGCEAKQPWPVWESYTKRFLDDQGRVIDRSANDRTTSEGEAYALFFALVDNDRAHFDKILNWSEANLAGGDLTLRLPAWNWGKNPAGEWKVLDDNSASDADLWMAYSLVEAGRLWHEPRYDKLGRTMVHRIAKQEVVYVGGLGTTLAPGPNGFHPDEKTWIINPSYIPLPLVVFFAKLMPQEPWGSVVESLPAVVGGGGESWVRDGLGFCWAGWGEAERAAAGADCGGSGGAGVREL